jgi:hypothetical protein
MPKVTLIAPATGISAAVAPSFASRLALFPERFADPASKSSEDAAADSTFAALRRIFLLPFCGPGSQVRSGAGR